MSKLFLRGTAVGKLKFANIYNLGSLEKSASTYTNSKKCTSTYNSLQFPGEINTSDIETHWPFILV